MLAEMFQIPSEEVGITGSTFEGLPLSFTIIIGYGGCFIQVIKIPLSQLLTEIDFGSSSFI